MFRALGRLFLSTERIFNIVDILASTGEAYAQQFQEEALAELDKKRAARNALTSPIKAIA